jgi:tetratricopeptide (TPR) repeat protein
VAAGSVNAVSRSLRSAAGLLLVAGLSAVAAEPTKERTPPGEAVAAGDIPLVKRVIDARREYRDSLWKLRQYYKETKNEKKLRMVEEELRQFHLLIKQAYIPELDVAVESVQGTKNVPKANELFREALAYKTRGGYGDTFIENQHRAEVLFQIILEKYPDCDKIGDVAYQLGLIYEGRAFQQYDRAVIYFERSWEWNPQTRTDARLRAARIYDRQLKQRDKAVKLYNEVENQDINPAHIEEAKRRITELTGSR